MNKKVITITRAKLISSLITVFLVLFVFCVFGYISISSLKIKSENMEKIECESMLEGYSNSFDNLIGLYLSEINYLDLNSNKTGIFDELYFVDKNLDALSVEINTIEKLDFSSLSFAGDFRSGHDINENHIYTEEMIKTGVPSCYVTRPLYDANNEYSGFLCGIIPLNKITSMFEKVKVEGRGEFYLVDSEGKILFSPDENKEFSKLILRNTRNKSFNEKTEIKVVENKKQYKLFCKNQNATNWTLLIVLPEIEMMKEFTVKNKYFLDMIVICLLSIVLIVFIEQKVFSKLQKLQIIQNKYDMLTKLWTRQHFETECSKIINRHAKQKLLVIESDIRGFKFINQNFGGEEADKLLCFYGGLLKNLNKNLKGYIARGYADHFYLMFKVDSVRFGMKKFNESLEKLNKDVKQYDISFTPKFGLSFYLPQKNKNKETIQTLIGQASFARSTIKNDMINQCAIYNSRLAHKIFEERFIEQHVVNAVEKGEFFVMYQPKISLDTEKISGAEALVRWRSPELGLLAPDQFIPMLEKNGYIKNLDFYVYEEVFKFIQKRLDAGKSIVPVSLNMSRNHSKPDKFMLDFMKIFNKYTIPPKLIQIEILERSVIQSNRLIEITDLLHKEGFSVAMDDFGSGESSLNMLCKVPVDVLKFDRSFLYSFLNESGQIDKKTSLFIKTLVDLSKSLDKESVFEGVETELQRDFLKSIQCDHVQGYFYSKPLEEDDFIEFLDKYI